LRYTFPRQLLKPSTSKREGRYSFAFLEPLSYSKVSRTRFSWRFLRRSLPRSIRKRSRRQASGNRRGPLRILLDTSFLLPTLGIDTGRDVARGLKRLSETNNQLHYSSFNILECLWQLARITKEESSTLEASRLGLRSIIEGRRYAKTNEDSRIFDQALGLYRMGHTDMIDNILYAVSLHHNLRFLTIDETLREFINRKRLENTLIRVDQIPTS
jgi:predicted nucleic acid-binding protein